MEGLSDRSAVALLCTAEMRQLRERPSQSKAGQGQQRPQRENCKKRILRALYTACSRPYSDRTACPATQSKGFPSRRPLSTRVDDFLQHRVRIPMFALPG